VTVTYSDTYDANGNMTEVSKQNGASVQSEKWLYTWNPRDQLTKVEKRTGTGAGTYAGQVEYAYCLSCEGALSYRKEYDQTSETSIRRYEYDGLKLLRVDEVYDSDSDNDLDDDFAANGGLGNWRTVEASTYGPGIVGNLLGKLVYAHTDNDATPDSQADYYYHYDHVGNVYLITDDEAEEVYRFSQDAFGNELDFGNYTGDSWATAAAAGIAEHQTGKWIDDFSGLYFFHARWYDSGVGRFVSRSRLSKVAEEPYLFAEGSPIRFIDVDGLMAFPHPVTDPWRRRPRPRGPQCMYPTDIDPHKPPVWLCMTVFGPRFGAYLGNTANHCCEISQGVGQFCCTLEWYQVPGRQGGGGYDPADILRIHEYIDFYREGCGLPPLFAQ
jgi:RHS repeat-associated protein